MDMIASWWSGNKIITQTSETSSSKSDETSIEEETNILPPPPPEEIADRGSESPYSESSGKDSSPPTSSPDSNESNPSAKFKFDDVSSKALKSAKVVGAFLFNVANKATKTVSDTAKQVKDTLEEKTILGDFKKEQEKFVKEKNATRSEEAVPPWVGYNEEESMKQQILDLSQDKRNFLRNPPSGISFSFDYQSQYPIAMATLEVDPNLQKMRFDLVPKQINEETFWRNYFYRVSLIKQSTQLTSLAQETGSTGENSSNKVIEKLNEEKGHAKSEARHIQSSSEEDVMPPDSPVTHEFVSDDAFQGSNINEEELKIGMEQLGMEPKKGPKKVNDDEIPEWEKELQQELQEYEVVSEGNAGDEGEWENEIQQMLEAEGMEHKNV